MENAIPAINLTYDLANVADSVTAWFGSFLVELLRLQ